MINRIKLEKVVMRKKRAHGAAINKVKALDESLIATGDDSGCIKIWDIRSRKIAFKYHENTDFISDMTFVGDRYTLIATSGDGCLSVYDIRKKKSVAVSANQDDELLSLNVVRNTSKVVVGTQSGTILLFSYGQWGDCTDRFPGHPVSVSSLVKATDTSLYTGSSDGIIRVIGM